MEDRQLLIVASFAALVSSAWGIYATGAKTTIANRWNDLLLWTTFIAQFGFLVLRGQAIGHCPLTTSTEMTAFLAWSLLLTYLVIGPAYRVSILGAFTAPLVFLMNFFALLQNEIPVAERNLSTKVLWLLELHASLSILAYGTLGLVAIASSAYLIQIHHLKKHDIGGWFYRLPSMGDLETVQKQVLTWGFVLLTFGMIAGVALSKTQNVQQSKVLWTVFVWLFYLLLWTAPRWARISHKRLAWGGIIGYILTLISFWLLNWLNHGVRS